MPAFNESIQEKFKELPDDVKETIMRLREPDKKRQVKSKADHQEKASYAYPTKAKNN
jgi:hypothetical protein